RRRKPLADAWSPSAARPGFERQPYEASPEAGGERQHDAEYGRVQMHVIMGIDVVEGDAGGSKGIELRPDFPLELPPRRRREEPADSRTEQVIWKRPARIDQVGNLFRRKGRATIDEHDMQTHA